MAAIKDFPGHLFKVGRFWHFQYYVRGRGLWKRSTKKSNYQQAIVEARRLYNHAQLLSASPESQPTFARALVREVARLEEHTGPRQAARVGVQLANFLAWAGDIALEKITTELLDRYQQKRIKQVKTKWFLSADGSKKRKPVDCGSTVSANTVGKEILSVVRLLTENGFQVRKPQPVKGPEKLGRPFTREELQRFFPACSRYRNGAFTPVFLLLLATGARPAEVIPSSREKSNHTALLKREVDLESETVTIRSAKVHGGRRGKVIRMKVMRPIIEAVLSVAKKTPGPHVFPSYDLGHAFDDILALAQIPKIDELGEKLTSHSFRHTFGTMLAEKGANAFVVQNVLRHADPKQTARYTERATTAEVINLTEFIIQKIEGPEAAVAD